MVHQEDASEAEGRRIEELVFAGLMRNSSDIICVLGTDAVITYASPSVLRVMGYEPDEVTGTLGLGFLHPTDLEVIKEQMTDLLHSPGTSTRFEARAQHRDGSWRWLEIIVSNLLEDPAVAGLVANMRDISEKKEVDGRLQTAKEAYRHLVERLPVVVYTAFPELDGDWLYISPQIHDLVGCTTEEVLADGLWAVYMHPEDRDRALAEETLSREKGLPFRCEYRLIAKDGRVVWVRDEAAVVHEPPGRPLLQGILLDITEEHRLREELEHQAFHDSLTGLANRSLFSDRVGHALARRRIAGAKTAVLFLDLDDFKKVNDNLGHDVGDLLLVEVARRLQSCVRPEDTAARLGGDEFALLIEDGSEKGVVAVAQRIIATTSDGFRVAGHEIFLSCSLGIAFSEGQDNEPEQLERNADVAMYRAKAEGKGRFAIYKASMHNLLVNRLELENDLRRALENDELTLHYQPFVDLRSGRIVGAEALLRWVHPTRGVVPPLQIIPIAEEMRLISDIAAWALGEACRKARWWNTVQRDDRSFRIAVNLSAMEFRGPELLGHVTRALEESGLAAQQLVLEITESILMEHAGTTMQQLHSLRALGVKLAVDDFGTGYSSLAYLRRFPIDILKIDGSFIEHVADGPEDSALAHAIVKLARDLGLHTIAEGIEKPEHLQALRAMGCDVGQGFLFAGPVGSTEMEQLLRKPNFAVEFGDVSEDAL